MRDGLQEYRDGLDGVADELEKGLTKRACYDCGTMYWKSPQVPFPELCNQCWIEGLQNGLFSLIQE